jgi:hypothetical protein
MSAFLWAETVSPRGSPGDALVVIVLLLALWVLAGAAVGHVRGKAVRRVAALVKWAASHGLEFSGRKDSDFAQRVGWLFCLHHGSGRYAINVMRGRWNNREVVAFDYAYTGYQPRGGPQECEFSAVIGDAGAALEPLFVRPKSARDKAVEAVLGVQDIEFESAEFNRRFFVQAARKRWAFDVSHPRMMEFLMAAPRFSLELGAGGVICYGDRLFRAGDFELACRAVVGVLDQLPDYARQRTPQRQTAWRAGDDPS